MFQFSEMPSSASIVVGGTIAAISAFFAFRLHSLTQNVNRKFPDGLPFKHRMMSHRGGGKEYIENTFPAFRNSARINVDIMEMDLQLTKDRKIVIFHDNDLKRLCGVNAKISDFNYEDLPKLLVPDHLKGVVDVDDEDTTKIPLFEKLLDEYPQYPMQIDVKRGPEELVLRVGNLILELNRQSKTVWGSFLPSVNEMCYRNFKTEIPLFFGLYRALAAVAMYKMGLFNYFGLRETCLIMPNFKIFMDAGFLATLNSRGVSTIVFGSDGSGALNREDQWDQARIAGVNGICTDRPSSILNWLKLNDLLDVNRFNISSD